MDKKYIWFIQNTEGAEYLQCILEFLLSEFSRIYGYEIMNNEKCLVYNDPDAECPMLITNRNPIQIRLTQPSLSYWAQTIFQLSHELCHYAIRQRKNDLSLSWIEEIICEGTALYALNWSAEHWKHCALYNKNSEFSQSIKGYLEQELCKTETDELERCSALELLKDYEENLSTNRASHRKQRNALYREIVKYPLYCKCFCNYPKYINNNHITIDFDKWEKEDCNPLIRVLHSFQPIT